MCPYGLSLDWECNFNLRRATVGGHDCAARRKWEVLGKLQCTSIWIKYCSEEALRISVAVIRGFLRCLLSAFGWRVYDAERSRSSSTQCWLLGITRREWYPHSTLYAKTRKLSVRHGRVHKVNRGGGRQVRPIPFASRRVLRETTSVWEG